jgi:hypothetical protein
MAQADLTMIIDYNNFVMRSLFTCQFMDPDVKINNFNTQTEIDTLIRKITMDICYIVRMFIPKRVILSCDSKSPWRKELYKDIDGMEYKGTREKDSDKNWENIFSVHKKNCCCAQAQIFLCAGAYHSFAVTNVPLCRNLAGSET